MQGSNALIGIAILAVALVLAVIAAVLLLRWRTVRRGQPKVPPPVDAGAAAPEKARDVHQDERDEGPSDPPRRS
jgi:hypothetical protein